MADFAQLPDDERDIDVGADGLQPGELDLVETGFPRLELTDTDGRTRLARAP